MNARVNHPTPRTGKYPFDFCYLAPLAVGATYHGIGWRARRQLPVEPAVVRAAQSALGPVTARVRDVSRITSA